MAVMHHPFGRGMIHGLHHMMIVVMIVVVVMVLVHHIVTALVLRQSRS